MKLLFFKGPWCVACHAIESQVPRGVVHIDCDVDQKTPVEYNVVNLPLFVAVEDDGAEVGRLQSTNVPMVMKWFEELQRDLQHTA